MERDDMRFNGGFPATRHSAIERIRDTDPDTRREAFGDLVAGYWKPVYKHLRLTWRLDAEDARDLTQGFFADAFQKAWLEKYEPGKYVVQVKVLDKVAGKDQTQEVLFEIKP